MSSIKLGLGSPPLVAEPSISTTPNGYYIMGPCQASDLFLLMSTGRLIRRFRNMFVLTIGINNYQHCPKLSWAVADADAVESFFRDVLAVPSHRIMSLRDESATRADIIKAFHALREDDSLMIERDDPIVVYFAGHGCQWTSRQGLQARIQAICPQDVQVQDSPDRTVFPIPDYLLGSLINQLSSKKGNNIVRPRIEYCRTDLTWHLGLDRYIRLLLCGLWHSWI